MQSYNSGQNKKFKKKIISKYNMNHITKEGIQMASSNMKNISMSLIIREANLNHKISLHTHENG